jgi:hypothetical protein
MRAAQKGANGQVQWSGQKIKVAVERALQCASYDDRELNPDRLPFVDADHSDFTAKRILTVEGVRWVDFAEVVHEIQIKELSDPEQVPRGWVSDWPESWRKPGARRRHR